MTKNVHKIRRAIKQRNAQKGKEHPHRQQMTSAPFTEEDKHGFEAPLYPYEYTSRNLTEKRATSKLTKPIICILFFVSAAFILTTTDKSTAPMKGWLTGQLQEEFPFASVKNWYASTFGGTPLSIAPTGSIPDNHNGEFLLPVTGEVVETFSDNGSGIKISPTHKSIVTAMDQGVVLFVGKKQGTAKTVIIQHADGTNTIYGHMSDVDVHAYQQVTANQRIGTFIPDEQSESVYFSIEKHQQFIDPFKVIPVDQLP